MQVKKLLQRLVITELIGITDIVPNWTAK